MIQGMMKYLGSTSGAVIKDNAVLIAQIMTKLVLDPKSEKVTCSGGTLALSALDLREYSESYLPPPNAEKHVQARIR